MRLSNFASPRHRRGFTLVEVLVAAGLCMLIMVMITTAFQRSMDTLSQLKSVGEMQQRLRSFETVIRNDLEAEHFEGGPKRVRDVRLDLLNANGLNNDNTPVRLPQMGFFRVVQGLNPTWDQPTLFEGSDVDNMPSTRATHHILHMTVKRDASRGDRVFATSGVPGGLMNNMAVKAANMSQMNNDATTLTSNWAEVAYFLDTTAPVGSTPGGTPLYGMYRRTRVIPVGDVVNSVNWATAVVSATDRAAAQGVSHSPSTGTVNDPATVRNPANRMGGMIGSRNGASTEMLQAEKDGAGNLAGSDLLMTDVLSFEIKGDWDGPAVNTNDANRILLPYETNTQTYEFPFGDFQPVPIGRNPALIDADPKYQAMGAGAPQSVRLRVFDTWYQTSDLTAANPQWLTKGTANTLPAPIRLRAIQIKVRVWDRKNNMARQVTIVQDM